MNKIKIKLKQNQKVTFRLNVKIDDAPILQNKTVVPLEEEQIVKADIGVYGLKEVVVKKIPDGYIPPSAIYEGDYVVTPLAKSEQILPTAKKNIQKDIVVKKIPYMEIEDALGGTTVIIGAYNFQIADANGNYLKTADGFYLTAGNV